MEIKVTSQYLNKEQIVLVESFVDYCVRVLKIGKFNDRIWVSVCECIEDGDEGDCAYDETSLGNRVKIQARYYKNMDKVLKIISHEMIHAKQYIQGNLVFIGMRPHWKGVDVSKVAYRERPHEIEAYSMENVLVEDFYKSRKKLRQRKPNQKSPI